LFFIQALSTSLRLNSRLQSRQTSRALAIFCDRGPKHLGQVGRSHIVRFRLRRSHSANLGIAGHVVARYAGSLERFVSSSPGEVAVRVLSVPLGIPWRVRAELQPSEGLVRGRRQSAPASPFFLSALPGRACPDSPVELKAHGILRAEVVRPASKNRG